MATRRTATAGRTRPVRALLVCACFAAVRVSARELPPSGKPDGARPSPLASRGVAGGTVFVVGERGLEEEMQAIGLRVLPPDAPERADFVVVGLDRQFNYTKLARAYKDAAAGAEFVATNRDPTYPLDGGGRA